LLLARNADLAIVYSAPDLGDQLSGEYLEAVEIRSDRLIPVFRSDLAGALRDGSQATELPFVAYPSDVFFGTIMADRILPNLDPRTVALPKAETALTIAALEMAAAGVAVAWVPQSLADLGLSQGRIANLTSVLPSCPLSVRAVRLRGARGPAEDVIWGHILALRTVG
jgi:DNA-binding transcriptional LysR family regulator